MHNETGFADATTLGSAYGFEGTEDSVGSRIIWIQIAITDACEHVWTLLRETTHVFVGRVYVAPSVHGAVQVVQKLCCQSHESLLALMDRLVTFGIDDHFCTGETRIVHGVL